MSAIAMESNSGCGRHATDERAVAVVVDLVSTPSVSGDEAAAVDRFVAHAESLGFETEIDDAGNGIAVRRARAESVGRPREIVLLGHIDTVAGRIPVRVEGGVLHGRGSVDAKGPLAAMLIGAARASLPEDVTLRVVAAVGEETSASPGAHHVAHTLKPHACIIGEPSAWDGVTLGYKGRLVVRAHTSRASAHSAGPDASAPDMLHAWWTDVRTLVERLSPADAPTFDQLQATIQRWGACDDGRRDSASMTVGFRLPPAIGPDDLIEAIEQFTPAGIELRYSSRERAHCTGRNDPVVRALGAAIRAEGGSPRPKRKTGTADLNVVAPIWQCPIAAYGPGDSALDHTGHEHLHLDEYLRSIRVLARAVEVLAGELSE